MASNNVTLGGIANALLAHPNVHRSAIITTPRTGNPTLDEIKLRFARFVIAIKYQQSEEIDELVGEYSASLDLVIADPYHSYESSVYCLESSLKLLKPGGILLCHDCVPAPDIADPKRGNDREWCGVTFAAFHDVMTSLDINWCTLAADYGLGLAIAPAAGSIAGKKTQVTPWTSNSHDVYLERYAADPFSFMRTVRAETWSTAVDRLREGKEISDLTAQFKTWDDLLPRRIAFQKKSRFHRGLYRVYKKVLSYS